MIAKVSLRVVVLCVTALSWCFGTAVCADLRIVGSDTMVNLNRELAGEFRRQNPDIRIDVNGGGSEAGIRALMSGLTDIAAASRALTDEERAAYTERHGSPPREIIVALDGLGIYVHNNNPVTSLTVDQVAAIMAGDMKTWGSVGGTARPITVYTRNRDSGTRTYMEHNVLQGKPFTHAARTVATTSLLVSSVARSQGAIGYGGIAYVRGAHVIRLSPGPGEPAVWPTYENVSSGAYPLSRPLHYYVNPDLMTEELERFLGWVRGAEGQRVVTFVGYYPAPGGTHDSAGATDEPVQLSTDNMAEFGFDIGVSVVKEGSVGGVLRSTVRIRFEPDGRAIERMSRVRMRVGDEVEAPIALNDGRTLEFTVRSRRLADTVILLSEDQAGPGSPVFMLRPRDFIGEA